MRTKKDRIRIGANIHAISRIVAWIGIALVGSNLTGCAAMKCFPHNYMCARTPAAPIGASHCNHECSECNAEPVHAAESVLEPMSQPHPMEGMQAAHWEELSTVQEQLIALGETDESLQEQLALLDSNAEQQRQERTVTEERIDKIASQVSGFARDLKNYQDDMRSMETSLMQQREEHEQVLASVEKQLVEVLREYR